jgi:hypothetical protein
MNCPKCNAANRPGSKFCTSCGLSFNAAQNASKADDCQKCNAALKPDSKFCTSCGTPVKNQVTPVADANPPSNVKPLSVIKDRIFWNVQKGEVAHRFNEAEMMQYDTAKGIIINEGTTAYIRANGVHVAEIEGGAYDFVEPQKLDETLDQRQGGVAGGVRAGFRFLSNLVLGRRVKDSIQSNEAAQNTSTPNTMASLIESMKKGQVFSVTLKLDKSFPLIFEIKDIETSILNATFGVHSFFKIDDFTKFSEYYLSDSDSVSFERIQKEFEPIIKAAIQEIVHNHELTEGRLPEELLQKIKVKIESAAAEFMHGLKLENIVEISSKSEDLARFRELTKELYLSEKELDHLQRLNQFNNLLTLNQNSQRLLEARTDADFHRVLTEINNSRLVSDARQTLDFDIQMQGITQERLLSDDEMDKFYMVLSREKRIREAKNEDEINAALIEIEKTGLLRTEDLENLKRSIGERSEDHDLQRFHTVALLQMNQTLEIDRQKLEWEYEIGDKRIDLDISRRRKELQAEVGYTQLEIERWKTEDDYKDSVFYKDLEKSKATQLQDLDIDKIRAKTQLELQKEKIDNELEEQRQRARILEEIEKRKHEQEMAARAQELSHAQAMEDRRIKEIAVKYEGSQNLSPEQLMAIAANENLDPIAAQKFAESFSAKHNSEQQKEFLEQFSKLNDQRIDDIKQMNAQKDAIAESDKDRLERMFGKLADTTSSMTGNLMGSKDQQKDEYKQRLERQENRMDNTQDKALDYTTRNNSFGNVNTGSNTTPPPPPSEYFVNLPSQQNVPRNMGLLVNMVKSGEIVDLTSIFSPLLNAWVPANSIDELKPYFQPINDPSKNNSKQCRNCGIDQTEEGKRFCFSCGGEL